MTGILQQERQAGIVRLTLNDPQTRNSLSEAMMAALADALAEAGRDADARVIVIAAEGPAFCSGHNLKEITAHRRDGDHGAAYFNRLMTQCAELMQAIVHHPLPVIAEVQAVASAAGCQLVASCDLAIAAEPARFATPGVNIGLFCSTPMVALSRNVTPKHAMEMLLTGDLIGAAEAQRIGLINRIVPTQLLRASVNELAAKIAGKSKAVTRIGKEAFYRQLDMTLPDAYDYAARVMVENLLIQDAKEGIGAFVDKRPPQWEDR
ncbi:enoyl-CoA hydratase [Nordella sp. HKS 07]|uniref:enoyl-CoA hydratase n=1 Tax=Nordella sp. HKS 07 TaxID=2712222 RepID=UPI0013E1583D|nr:enoyl-CoA hydratase [Nordella sp. HKS 07]QIG50941.1 enoyl-CoA hydratase [Nordella sp. HKS 07]